jgi:repressor LexA
MRDLTGRQQEVLTFVADYIAEHSYSPTIRELAEYFSISVKGAHDHITALKKKGCLRQQNKRSRTLELVRAPGQRYSEEVIHIPVLGTVAAGKPTMSEENWDGTVILHRTMLKIRPDQDLALKSRGDSKEGAGILDGDTAIIEKREAVKNGEIAVVMLDDAVTIKTFYRENTRIRLQPENPKYAPIYCSHDIRILGRLTRLLRSY